MRAIDQAVGWSQIVSECTFCAQPGLPAKFGACRSINSGGDSTQTESVTFLPKCSKILMCTNTK